MSRDKLNIEEFIDIVKEYPVLYDKTGTFAQNNEEKNMAWKVNIKIKMISTILINYFKEIAKKVHLKDLNYLKSKWRNLRDTYQKAVKNRRDLEEIGMIHKYKEYKHEHQMSYLYEHILSELSSTSKRKRKGSGNFQTAPFKK